MCVSAKEAEFSNTKGYIGEKYINGELFHVLGYQNVTQNLTDSGNAMILHFPTSESMDEKNVISITDNDTEVFNNMLKALSPKTQSRSLMKAVTNSVKIFDVGIYTVLMSDQPSLIYEKLKDIPENKRPKISFKLMKWYEKKYKGWNIAVCCFDSKEEKKSNPLFWYYKPLNKKELLFPAIDSHSGNKPLKDIVEVDHEFMVSLNDDIGIDVSHYKNDFSSDLKKFINNKTFIFKCHKILKNGDFIFKKKDLEKNHNLNNFKRRFP